MAKFPVYEVCKKMRSHSATVWQVIIIFSFLYLKAIKLTEKNLWHVNYELHFAVQLLYKPSSL
jgi:hypothetical protein